MAAERGIAPLLTDAAALPEEALEQMACALPAARREAVNRRRGEARREAVAAAYLALYALVRTHEAAPEPSWPSVRRLLAASPEIAALGAGLGWPTGRYGQPFPDGCVLNGKGKAAGIRFVSLSHSGGVAAAAACPAPIGLDLQGRLPEPADRLLRIAGKFHPSERERLEDLPAGELPAAFRRLWAAKESVLKLCGRGLNLSPAAFCVREDGTGELEGRGFRVVHWETEAGSLAAAVWT